MATTNTTETGFGKFLDNIWLLAILTTIITVLWQFWIFYEILWK